jgi:phosphinothricin acetyltransferase
MDDAESSSFTQEFRIVSSSYNSRMPLHQSGDVGIENMRPLDWPAVCKVYAEGIATANATFETETPSWEKWNAAHIDRCRFVAREGKEIIGWAALSRVWARKVYAGVAEVSVYVAEQARGRGVGSKLLQTLVTASEQAGFWTLQAGIFAENIASIRLHEVCGFRVVGRREKIARLHGVWRDTVLMERRSAVVGL